MKKGIVVFLSGILLFIFSSCSSGVSQEEYDSLKNANQELQAQLDEAIAVNNRLEDYIEGLQTEYDNYKNEMSPYEGLSEAEAEAKKIEAEKVIQQQEAEDEAQRQAEEAAKAAGEAKGYETGITYDNIARNPSDYIGKKVKFTGSVVQLIEGTITNEIRFAIDDDYDMIIYCTYNKDIVDSRILEDDVITIYGTAQDTITYQSALGGQITIPYVSIDRIEQ